MADMVIGFLQDMGAFTLLTYHGQEHQPHAEILADQLPTPVFEGNTAEQLEKCILDDEFRALENGNKVITTCLAFQNFCMCTSSQNVDMPWSASLSIWWPTVCGITCPGAFAGLGMG